MIRKRRRQFSREFKLEAVRLIVDEGRSISQVARDLGLRDTVLGRWKKEFESNPEEAFPGTGRMPPAEEELCRLRRENERLRMERDILKKAVAIFSEEPQ